MSDIIADYRRMESGPAKWAAENRALDAALKADPVIASLCWRAKMTMVLVRDPFFWSLREAWDYATSMRVEEVRRTMNDPDEIMMSPREALDEDRQYWED